MNKIVFALIISLFLFLNNRTKAQEVDAYFYYAPFYVPGSGTYVETYLAFAGHSMRYLLNTDKVFEASAEVTMLFKNDADIVEYRKFKVVSPGLPDTTSVFPSFIDQHRIMIPEGVYNFELTIRDINAPDSIKPFELSELITVHIPPDEISFSGIELIERYEATQKQNIFVKNGYECIPYVSDFFPNQINQIKFYAELYNAAISLGPMEDFLFQFHIESSNTHKPIKEFSSFQKQKAQNVNVVFNEINISKLPTGNYYLVIEVRDRQNNQILEKRKFFQRKNNYEGTPANEMATIEVQHTFAAKYTNKDTLAIYLSSLRPISDIAENRFIDNQLVAANLKMMQQYFYSFWQKRNETNPELAWNEYRLNLNVVEQKYSSQQKHGFATDRGRVYLQYGPPSSIIEEKNEPNAYPYEIWHYYKIADQTDRKFIFYNKTLLNQDYELLNSTMKGEMSNSFWESELYSRSGNWVESNLKTNKSKARELFEGK